MTLILEELSYQKTPLGDISLRKRSEPRLDNKILYEVKLNDEFLMSSLFPEAEIQLAKLGLSALKDSLSEDHADKNLNIVVGGLGLGYTAAAVLDDPSVKALIVIDVMQPVIEWHQNGLVPLGEKLTLDTRCKLVHADFFELAMSHNASFDQNNPDQKAHAILLDIDHSPSHWLNSENSQFYTKKSLQSLADKIQPGGFFGLWSNDPPEDKFITLLDSVFKSSSSHIITFPNPYTGAESTNTIYLANKSYT
ncbi:MAG: spermidine synthase [Gammaproteobacteria bacterium]